MKRSCARMTESKTRDVWTIGQNELESGAIKQENNMSPLL
jgi:hypothetical protein